VVLADALTDPALREHAPQAEWIDVGKRGFAHATGQARINALLVEHALAGRRVARLKGGDPSIFGRLEEELQALAEVGVTSEVIPGVTAALAAAQSQRPLTRRGQGRTVALTTAMTLQHALQAGHHADTEVFYMAGQQLAALSDSLQACGWPKTRRSAWCLGPAAPMRSSRPTPWARWPRRPPCTQDGRRSSPSGSGPHRPARHRRRDGVTRHD
jgi:uroporphyrin-III C-methyltransferase